MKNRYQTTTTFLFLCLLVQALFTGSMAQDLFKVSQNDEKPIFESLLESEDVANIAMRPEGSAGALDQTFKATIGMTAIVDTVAIQTDGKTLIAGNFTFANSTARNRLARLNTDGSVDETFDPGAGANGSIADIAVTADGKILVAGQFSLFNGIARRSIARLNNDGTLDSDFAPVGSTGRITSVTEMGNGNIILGGALGIVRLLPNGVLDPSFASSITSGLIEEVIAQPDGKVLVGGYSLGTSGVRFFLARLNTSGSLDFSYVTDFVLNNGVAAIAIAENGQIFLAAGPFVKRFHASGNLDNSFAPVANDLITDITVEADGSVIIAGIFTQASSQPRSGVAKYSPAGSLTPYAPQLGKTTLSSDQPSVATAKLDGNGRLIVGGLFTVLNGNKWNGIARFETDGSVDPSFRAGVTDILGENTSGTEDVFDLKIQADGRILTAGRYNTSNGAETNFVSRFEADGSLDPTFNPNFGTNDNVLAIAIDDQGRILIGGEFTQVNGQSRTKLARLLPDGSLDLSFHPVPITGPNSSVQAIALDSQQRIVLGGIFTTVDGSSRIKLVRLNSNGTLDPSFNPQSTGDQTGIDALGSEVGGVFAVAIQSGDRVVIGGRFQRINGVTRNRLARYSSTGVLDPNFDPNVGGQVSSTAIVGILPFCNDKLLISGRFASAGGRNNDNITLLNADGTGDTTFGNNGAITNGAILSALVQPDGKITIAGDFTRAFGNIVRNRVARLQPNGSLDPTFDPGPGCNSSVFAAALQGPNIIVGGRFTSAGGSARGRMARFFGSDVPDPTPTPTPTITPTPTPPRMTVSIGGRVMTPNGTGLRNAVVTLTDAQGGKRTATTSSFGVYSFEGIFAGESYILSVGSKRFRFSPRNLLVNLSRTDIDFLGLE